LPILTDDTAAGQAEITRLPSEEITMADPEIIVIFPGENRKGILPDRANDIIMQLWIDNFGQWRSYASGIV
jgi:hypothetical protein